MDLFNDMYIEKLRSNGDKTLFRVPIQFANRHKFLSQLETRVQFAGDHDGRHNDARFEIDSILPRLSVNILSLSYDPVRHISKTQKIYACDPCSLSDLNHPSAFTPAPWNMELELSVLSKNMDDGLQIIEQIIPFFQPSLSINIKNLEGFASDSVPIILDSVTPTIDEEMDNETPRVFVWILNFRMKLAFHMPKKISGRVNDIIFNIHPNEKGAEGDQFTQYQFAAELRDDVVDSTSHFAMIFEHDPETLQVKSWNPDLPTVDTTHGDTAYQYAIIRSEGGYDTTGDSFYMTDLGGVQTWLVTIRYNLVKISTTTSPDAIGAPQSKTFKETTTDALFAMAITAAGVLDVTKI
jgi:hypothetical protein